MANVEITGFWTFFCNPAKWQIDECFLAGEEIGSFKVTSWQEPYFEPGQFGIIRVGQDRRSKKLLGHKKKLEPGVYAIVEILSKPVPGQKGTDQYWLVQK